MKQLVHATIALALASGCTIRHYVAEDYPQYLIARLTAGAEDPRSGLLVFDLQSYEFADMGAHLALRVTRRRGGAERRYRNRYKNFVGVVGRRVGRTDHSLWARFSSAIRRSLT